MSKEETSDRAVSIGEIGEVIAGKFRVDGILGHGGMGRVLAATHLQLDEQVALKFLSCANRSAEEVQARFLREAQVTAKLRGEHITRLKDFGVLADGTPFIVMELLEGLTLRTRMDQSRQLPINTAIEYIAQTCEGLAEAHARGVVHRDLKPPNIFITQRIDGTEFIKIMDFGVSKIIANVDQELTTEGMIIGSPKYMAPEQISNSGTVDHRADLWSLGVILYEMLAGAPPFVGESMQMTCMSILSGVPPKALTALRPDISEQLERAVLHVLTHDLERRSRDVGVFVRELYEATSMPGLDVVAQRIEGILLRGESLGESGAHKRVRGPGTASQFTGDSKLLTPSNSRTDLVVVNTGREFSSSSAVSRGKAEPDSASHSGVDCQMEDSVVRTPGKASIKRVGLVVAAVAVVVLSVSFWLGNGRNRLAAGGASSAPSAPVLAASQQPSELATPAGSIALAGSIAPAESVAPAGSIAPSGSVAPAGSIAPTKRPQPPSGHAVATPPAAGTKAQATGAIPATTTPKPNPYGERF